MCSVNRFYFKSFVKLEKSNAAVHGFTAFSQTEV